MIEMTTYMFDSTDDMINLALVIQAQVYWNEDISDKDHMDDPIPFKELWSTIQTNVSDNQAIGINLDLYSSPATFQFIYKEVR